LDERLLLVPLAFPNLRKLHLVECALVDFAAVASLVLCQQLQELHITHCKVAAEAIETLPALKQLPHLQRLVWNDSHGSLGDGMTDADASWVCLNLSKVDQLTAVNLNSNRLASEQLISAAAQMTRLRSYEMAPLPSESCYRRPWAILDNKPLKQLLTSCSLLTQLSLDTVILDQAGLDLLLAHPHITHVTFLAIAATESRVNSPCSWRALSLPPEVDIRIVANVPLRSLEEPLQIHALLLPPGVCLEVVEGSRGFHLFPARLGVRQLIY
jgi:hypothetical protein